MYIISNNRTLASCIQIHFLYKPLSFYTAWANSIGPDQLASKKPADQDLYCLSFICDNLYCLSFICEPITEVCDMKKVSTKNYLIY